MSQLQARLSISSVFSSQLLCLKYWPLSENQVGSNNIITTRYETPLILQICRYNTSEWSLNSELRYSCTAAWSILFEYGSLSWRNQHICQGHRWRHSWMDISWFSSKSPFIWLQLFCPSFGSSSWCWLKNSWSLSRFCHTLPMNPYICWSAVSKPCPSISFSSDYRK